MGGLARIARERGHAVTGCDAQVYPPMSDQLRDIGIELHEGYDAAQLGKYEADLYIVGNAMTRGKPVIEAILDRGLPYVSGPQWLAENVLREKWVLAVAGTHGKSTTSSMLAWILQEVITLVVFVPFAIFYMGEGLKLNYLWAGLCLVGAVYFIFS